MHKRGAFNLHCTKKSSLEKIAAEFYPERIGLRSERKTICRRMNTEMKQMVMLMLFGKQKVF